LKHPQSSDSEDLFGHFAGRFERYLIGAMERAGLASTNSLDENIALLGKANHEELRRVLNAARADTVGAAVPENRAGDRIAAYKHFVVDHLRTPSDTALLFHDVLYRLKVGDEIMSPLRVFVSDKELVKLYVAGVIGDAYNVPILSVLRTAEEIERYDFPTRCCIKPTHASGTVLIRRAGEPIDIEWVKSWLLMSYYRSSREGNYQSLEPKVMVEPLVFDSDSNADYRLYCFSGSVRMIGVDTDRSEKGKLRRSILDTSWKKLPFTMKYPPPDIPVSKPDNLSEMIRVAEKLASNFGLIRIDLYSNGSRCLVGEITNIPGGGHGRFIPAQGEAVASEILFGKA
jgi:hypothetical protein